MRRNRTRWKPAQARQFRLPRQRPDDFDLQVRRWSVRILLLVDCYLPSAKSGAKQMRDLAVEFHRQGHDVIVLTPSHEIAGVVKVTREEGARIIRVRTGHVRRAVEILRARGEIRLDGTV